MRFPDACIAGTHKLTLTCTFLQAPDNALEELLADEPGPDSLLAEEAQAGGVLASTAAAPAAAAPDMDEDWDVWE